MIKPGIVTALFASFVLCTPPAQAQTLTDVIEAMAADDFVQAEALARQVDAKEGRGDILAAFVAASRLEAEDRCADAVVLADAVVTAIPFFTPAYMIAYRCYSQLGQNELAAERLRALSGVVPPGPERDVVLQLLQNEEARYRPTVSGYVNVVPSTNANRQTSESALIPGLPWTIPEEARGQSGVIFQAGASVARRLWGTDALSLSGVLRTDIRYSTADERFEPFFTAEMPLTFRPDAERTFIATPYATVGLSDGTHTLTEAGLRNAASFALSDRQRLAVNLKLAAIEQPQNTRRSGYAIDGSVALSSVLSETMTLTTTLGADFNHTNDPDLHTLELSAKGRLDALVWDGLLVGLEGTVGQRLHNRPPPLSLGPDQSDVFISGKLDLSHRDIAIGPVMPSVYYQYTRSWSDNVYYTYDSHDIGITFRTRF